MACVGCTVDGEWGPWLGNMRGGNSQLTGESLALRQRTDSTSCPSGPPSPTGAPSPGPWERNVPEGQAGEEGQCSDKCSQMPVACSCCRLHDRGQQLSLLPGSASRDHRPVGTAGGESQRDRQRGGHEEMRAPRLLVSLRPGEHGRSYRRPGMAEFSGNALLWPWGPRAPLVLPPLRCPPYR